MLKKLRVNLFLKLILIPIIAITITIIFSQWKYYNGALIFSLSIVIIGLIVSLINLQRLRKAINKLAKIGEYVVIKNFVDDDTLYVMGFVDSFVQKLVLSHSETGLIVLFKYSQVKKPLLILWKEMKSYEVLEEDNLICFDFFYSDVRLYVPYDNNLIKVFKRMTGVVDV